MAQASEVAIPEAHHALLNEEALGMLTTIRRDGMLSTNPVGFLLDHGRIRISTLRSRYKVRNVQADSRVAFCCQSTKNPLYYVEIRGRATIEDDPGRAFFRAQFKAGSGSDPPDDVDPPEAERVILTIHAEKVSAPSLYGGRFDLEG